MKTASLWKTKTNRAGGYVNNWSTMFEARVEGERHHLNQTILRYVQKAPDDIRWEIDRDEFHELMATKEESAPGPDGIPKSLNRCGGGLGSQFLYKAYKHVIEGGPCSGAVCREQNCFHYQILRCRHQWTYCEIAGGEGPRPLTLCDCDCKILTTAICQGFQWHTMRCLHPFQRCISSRKMTDNIFEVEAIALAHVEFAGKPGGQFLMARGVRQGCLASGILLPMAYDPIFSLASGRDHPKKPCHT